MKIVFLGAGALGSALGSKLTEAGHEVHLVCRSAAHVEAMQRDGLRIREASGDKVVRVQASTDCRGIGPADLVVVLVKSFNTREAIEGAASILGPETAVMSLQNGLGNEDVIGEVVGQERVLGGKTYAGGVLIGPGHIVRGTDGKETIIGELDGRSTPRIRRIAEVFGAAGLPTIVSDNIVGTIWDKLLINVATGALAGITRLTYGELYAVPEVEACAVAAVGEGIAVASALGVKLSSRVPRDAWAKASAGLPAEFKTSMLQSLEKGSPTEIDFINGAVVRRGEQCGVPTPVNRTLVACVKGIERGLKA